MQRLASARRGVAVLGGMLALAGAAEAQVGRFSGGGVVSNFNQACRDAGMLSATTPYTILYQPRSIGSNGNLESLAFLAPWGALTYTLEGRSFGSAFQTVTTAGIFHGAFVIPPDAANAARLRLTNRTPASVSAATRSAVILGGEIQNWSGVLGCTVRFDAALGQDIR